MKLTQRNYYGPKANKIYMSKSQLHNWQQCEAATYAELRGLYKPEDSVALLVGGYIDAAIDSPRELAKYKAKHPEILNSCTGALKANYKQGDEIIERIKSDRLFSLLTGNTPETKNHVQRQVILVGEIGGVPFRGKADFIVDKVACELIMAEFPETAEALGGPFCEGAMVDLKSTKDFASVWNDEAGARLNWIDAWGYDSQGGIYTELYRQMTGISLPFIIVAATKEKVTDIDAFYIPQADLDAALHIVEDLAPLYQEIKDGKREPIRCEQCEWCKRTKKLTKIKNYKEI